MNEAFDVIVVGAGYAGIHCAAELERASASVRVLVLEASDRIGGRAWTKPAEHDRPAVDMGAHYFGVDHERVGALARRLLGDDQIYSHIPNFGPDPAFRTLLDREWRLTTRSSSFFNIQGLSKRAPLLDRIRIFESLTGYLALEGLVNVREPWKTPMAERLDQITVAQWIAAQRMPQWINDLWELGCVGLLSAPTKQISLLYWLWYNASNGGFLQSANDFTGGPQEFGVRGGLGGLLALHARELRGGLRFGAQVTEIDHGDWQRVTVTLASGEQLTARHVVVAVSPATAGKTIRFTPALSPARQRLHEQPMGHACKAVIHYKKAWWRDSHGHHFIGYGGGAGSQGAEWGLDTTDPATEHYTMMVFINPALFARGGDREALVADELVRMSGDERARDHQGMDLFDWTSESVIGGGPNTIMGCGVLSQLEPVFRRPELPSERLHFTAAEYATQFCGYVEGAMEAGEHTAMQINRAMQGQREMSKVERRGPKPLQVIGSAAAFATIVPVARVVALISK